MDDTDSTTEIGPVAWIPRLARRESGCREECSLGRTSPKRKPTLGAPIPRPLIRLFGLGCLEQLFISGQKRSPGCLSRFLSPEHNPLPFAFHSDHFTAQGIVKKTKPMFSRFRCFHLFH